MLLLDGGWEKIFGRVCRGCIVTFDVVRRIAVVMAPNRIHELLVVLHRRVLHEALIQEEELVRLARFRFVSIRRFRLLTYFASGKGTLWQ